MNAAGMLNAGVALAASFSSWLVVIQLFTRYSKSPVEHRKDLPAGSRLRAVTVGGLWGVAIAVRASLTGTDAAATLPMLFSLVGGFLLPALYCLIWLVLMTVVGQQDVLAGELGLVMTAILMGCLWVFGFLWITLIVLGSFVLFAFSMATSFFISRYT